MATLQHLAEYSIGIVTAFIGAFGVLVVHPCKNDNLALGVVAEEETVLLKKFGAKPVLVVFTERVSLPVSLTAVMEPPMFGVMEPQTGE